MQIVRSLFFIRVWLSLSLSFSQLNDEMGEADDEYSPVEERYGRHKRHAPREFLTGIEVRRARLTQQAPRFLRLNTRLTSCSLIYSRSNSQALTAAADQEGPPLSAGSHRRGWEREDRYSHRDDYAHRDDYYQGSRGAGDYEGDYFPGGFRKPKRRRSSKILPEVKVALDYTEFDVGSMPHARTRCPSTKACLPACKAQKRSLVLTSTASSLSLAPNRTTAHANARRAARRRRQSGGAT